MDLSRSSSLDSDPNPGRISFNPTGTLDFVFSSPSPLIHQLLATTPISSSISAPTVDNSAEIWSICLTHAEKFDRALVESWKGDMDGILIFVRSTCSSSAHTTHLSYPILQSGLFSAVVSTFLANSSQFPDPATATAILTSQTLTLLANSTNQSLPNVPDLPTQNSLKAYRIINSLWFLSLVFSLACALSATLVQQWSRIYLQGTEERFIPHERARMRTYLQRGVQNFHLADMVDAIPMYVISLF